MCSIFKLLARIGGMVYIGGFTCLIVRVNLNLLILVMLFTLLFFDVWIVFISKQARMWSDGTQNWSSLLDQEHDLVGPLRFMKSKNTSPCSVNVHHISQVPVGIIHSSSILAGVQLMHMWNISC